MNALWHARRQLITRNCPWEFLGMFRNISLISLHALDFQVSLPGTPARKFKSAPIGENLRKLYEKRLKCRSTTCFPASMRLLAPGDIDDDAIQYLFAPRRCFSDDITFNGRRFSPKLGMPRLQSIRLPSAADNIFIEL